VVATWLDAGIENVRSVLPSGKSDYTASHSFVEDWRTHRAWNWLNSSIWRFIPTNQQLLAVQVRGMCVCWGYCLVELSVATNSPHRHPLQNSILAARSRLYSVVESFNVVFKSMLLVWQLCSHWTVHACNTCIQF
jgi:hypothetical protein